MVHLLTAVCVLRKDMSRGCCRSWMVLQWVGSSYSQGASADCVWCEGSQFKPAPDTCMPGVTGLRGLRHERQQSATHLPTTVTGRTERPPVSRPCTHPPLHTAAVGGAAGRVRPRVVDGRAGDGARVPVVVRPALVQHARELPEGDCGVWVGGMWGWVGGGQSSSAVGGRRACACLPALI